MKKLAPILTVIVGYALVGFLHVNEASAGCRINISGRNDSNWSVWFSYRNSKVKIKGGTWKKIFKGHRDATMVEGHSNFNFIYDADFGCNVKRRWVFTLEAGDACNFEYSWYKPSNDGWFPKGTTEISVHELSRKCN